VKAVINTSAFDETSCVQGSCAFGDGLDLSGMSGTTIAEKAFDGCTEITGSLILPTTLATIGNSAFYYCAGINNITASYNSEPSWSGSNFFQG
jgi:hypothetical protein